MDEKKIACARTETNPALLKNFYRTYYDERFRTLRIILLVIAVVLFLAAAAVYYNGFGIMWTVIFLWLGLLFVIYPRNAYRKPYKKAKDTKTVTHFDFYAEYMSERSNGVSERFRYGDIYRTMETNQYFYIFHSPDSVSVVEKKDISFGSAEEICELLKSKTKYTIKK